MANDLRKVDEDMFLILVRNRMKLYNKEEKIKKETIARDKIKSKRKVGFVVLSISFVFWSKL